MSDRRSLAQLRRSLLDRRASINIKAQITVSHDEVPAGPPVGCIYSTGCRCQAATYSWMRPPSRSCLRIATVARLPWAAGVPRLGRGELERSVRPLGVVMVDELAKHAL